MKKRTLTLLNFLALNVLFFALYLNFFHKDTNVLPAVSAASNAGIQKLSSQPEKSQVASLVQKQKAASLEN